MRLCVARQCDAWSRSVNVFKSRKSRIPIKILTFRLMSRGEKSICDWRPADGFRRVNIEIYANVCDGNKVSSGLVL